MAPPMAPIGPCSGLPDPNASLQKLWQDGFLARSRRHRENPAAGCQSHSIRFCRGIPSPPARSVTAVHAPHRVTLLKGLSKALILKSIKVPSTRQTTGPDGPPAHPLRPLCRRIG
ncbi:hypothetical protein EYF80_056904 [Liparis tanakae]|uniref:Uncharacterized protein n=1 Tax=Liparis tanakae TaxID=230148 RepID=A0A4Z2EXF4_9TELE|nr:hypothetical protein EYF80_056904 [Liparis tanakae]